MINIFTNKYKICDNYVILYLKRRGKKDLETYIDIDDFDKVKNFGTTWFSHYYKNNNSNYAMTTIYLGTDGKGNFQNKTLFLHRLIIETDDTKFIDHINHNTLDNRKDNLRIIDAANNSANRKGANKNNKTGHRNVHWMKRNNEYWVQIMCKGKRYKWKFPADKYQEACDFSDIKREELFGIYAGKG